MSNNSVTLSSSGILNSKIGKQDSARQSITRNNVGSPMVQVSNQTSNVSQPTQLSNPMMRTSHTSQVTSPAYKYSQPNPILESPIKRNNPSPITAINQSMNNNIFGRPQSSHPTTKLTQANQVTSATYRAGQTIQKPQLSHPTTKLTQVNQVTSPTYRAGQTIPFTSQTNQASQGNLINQNWFSNTPTRVQPNYSYNQPHQSNTEPNYGVRKPHHSNMISSSQSN